MFDFIYLFHCISKKLNGLIFRSAKMKLHYEEAEDPTKINLGNMTDNQIGFILELLTKLYKYTYFYWQGQVPVQ